MARAGLATNEVEIDKQFLELKDTIAPSDATVSGSTAATGAAAVQGTITGMQIETGIVGGFGVKWNKVNPQPDYVEIQVCTDQTFISSKTKSYNVGALSNSFVFGAGEPDRVYFVRVRGIFLGQPGVWSAVFNSETGKATTSHILDGAASSRLRVEYTSFSPPRLGFDGTAYLNQADYGNTALITHGQIVLVFAILEFEWQMPAFDAGNPSSYIDMDLLEDGVSIFSYRNARIGDLYVLGTGPGYVKGYATLPFVAIPSTPIAGTHEYAFRINVNTDGAGNHDNVQILWLELKRLVLAFVELLR